MGVLVDNYIKTTTKRLFEENEKLQQELNEYKAKEKELREYLKYETEYGLWKIRGNEDEVKDIVENDILNILDRKE